MGNFLNTDFSDLEDNSEFNRQRKANCAGVMKDIIDEKKRKAALSERNLLRFSRLKDTDYACGPLIRQCMHDLGSIAEGGGAGWAATAVFASQLGPYVRAKVYDWVESLKEERTAFEGTFVSAKALEEYEERRRRDTLNSEREPVLAYFLKIKEAYEADRKTALMDDSGWEMYADLVSTEGEDTVSEDTKFRLREKVEERYKDPTRFSSGNRDFSLEGLVKEYCTPPEPQRRQLELYAARKHISFEQALKLAGKARGNQVKLQRRDHLAQMLIKEFREGIMKRHTHLGDYLPSWLAARVLVKLQEHCQKRLDALDERVLTSLASDDYIARDNSDAVVYEHWSQMLKEELVRLLPDVELQGAELD